MTARKVRRPGHLESFFCAQCHRVRNVSSYARSRKAKNSGKLRHYCQDCDLPPVKGQKIEPASSSVWFERERQLWWLLRSPQQLPEIVKEAKREYGWLPLLTRHVLAFSEGRSVWYDPAIKRWIHDSSKRRAAHNPPDRVRPKPVEPGVGFEWDELDGYSR